MRGAPARGSRLTVPFVFVSLLSFVSLLAPADAEAAGKRIGVPKFEGAQEALVRKKVMQALKAHGYELVRSRDMADAMSSTGAGLDTDDGLKTLAKELSLSAIVTGEVGGKRAKIVVHDGGEGSILGDASFGGANPRKLATDVGLKFWKKLGPDVGRGHVPEGAKKGQKASAVSAEDDEGGSEGGAGAAAAGGGEAATPKPADDSASAEGAGSDEDGSGKKKRKKLKMEEAPPEEAAAPSGYPWLDFELGGGGLNRSLSYNQNVQINGTGILLRPYTLGSGPIGTANVVMYPLDPLVGGALGNIGLEAEIQQGFAISSGAYNNTVHDFAGGARYRFPFGAMNELYISATGGEDAFTFTGPGRGTLTVPDTIYQYFRPGVGVKMFVVGGLSLAVSAGYRVVFNGAGSQLSDAATGLFPHLTVAGADAEAVAGLRLSDMFELRAGLEWRRYWFAMHSVASDANRANSAFAGGATDQSFAFTARIAILLGGTKVPKSEGGSEGEEPPPAPKPNKNRARKDSSDDESTSGGDSDTGESPSVESGGHKSGGDTDE